MKTFEELGVSPEIRKAIEEMGYENPMPVQEEVIPYLLGDGNDVVALAQTGTGKTAAYGLPLIQRTDVSKVVPQSLILCPTRELCLQISGDLTDYSKYIDGLKVLPVYGGSSIQSQIRMLKSGVHIIVATPGRLIDLMKRNVAKLDTVNNVVMDEADEMLDMGFSEDLNAILEQVPQERNTLMFSATMSNDISRIAKQYLRNAKEITIGTKNEGSNNVNHVAYIVRAKDKYAALKRIVDYYPQIYGIIFCRTRLETQEVADKLIQDGYDAEPLHGDLSQAQRDLVMQKFRQRHLQLLVATDVAARGLDVSDLTHVINYGFPDDNEVYTHRSGRTGRAGKTGISMAIINLRERGKLRDIERTMQKKFTIGTLPTGKQICEQQLLKVIDDVEKVKVNEDEIKDFLPDVYRKWEWLSKEDLIKRMVSLEFNRFLEYYSNADEVESLTLETKKEKSVRKDRCAERERRTHTAEKGYTRIFITLGKKDGIVPNKLIELINRNTKGQHIEVGRIDLMQNLSFFEVPNAQADDTINALNGINVKGRRIVVEIARENTGKSDISGRKRGSESNSSRRGERAERRRGGRSERRESRSETQSRKTDRKADSSDRKFRKKNKKEEEFVLMKESAKKDDWKQFFIHNEDSRKKKK
ncbi:DEAD/DEAH box helicase [Phocaeicola oris]|uniref:DEAD/DEAH box helicase n=1 Tax=Phocaeicola oris TaxID=2896850 RepID=UPI00234F2B31|nr:DEAD/DEAH box helicase [Phocaeicola oris]MCE2617675.1 DEAD/DEAH box helicase [Phocaeicola oris]